MNSTGRLLEHWLPPEAAGRPLGCLATTFTFDADFFEEQCVGRFLGLDTRPGEAPDELSYVIEREEKLRETPVCVIADRSLNPDSRSLHWDVLTVAAPTGVMHAKVALLVWESAVRVLVTSANLSRHAYRHSIELAAALEATAGAELPEAIFDELLDAVEATVTLAPPGRLGSGPRPRALDIVARARARIASFKLPDRPRRGSPAVAVVRPRAGKDALAGTMDVWSGGPPRRATAMSPYFDVGEGPSRAATRLFQVLAKREASVDFVVPVDRLEGQQLAHVPRALLDAGPSRIRRALWDVKQPDPAEPRSLHGKLLLLESAGWIAALVGSSNFTAAGLGLDGGGNVEIGLAIGAPRSSGVGEALAALSLKGHRLELNDVGLEPHQDPEELMVPIPAGFVQVLGEPGNRPTLEFELDPAALPRWWTAQTPDGQELITSERWQVERKPLLTIPAPTGRLPFYVALEWRAPDGSLKKGSFPVNVTEPSRLPPPAELRALPLDALLRALASVRPLHEAVIEAVRRSARSKGRRADELDPLKRFSPSGQFLHRTRELSAALTGLRERLEQPAASLDAFRWRLEGPFGPVEVARKLVEERRQNRSVSGEEAFMLAEVGLTLAGVDIARTSRFLTEQAGAMREAVREVTEEVASLCPDIGEAPALGEYVREAFEKASR